MAETTFTIADRQLAKREFPRRLMRAALRHYGCSPDNSYGINAKIADDAGVDRSAVTRWLKGALPKAEKVLLLANAYGISPDQLVGNDNTSAPTSRLRTVEAQMQYSTLIKVLRIMSELRPTQVNHEWFAQATVEVLQMVESDPTMTDDAITGAAYRLLRNGPSS